MKIRIILMAAMIELYIGTAKAQDPNDNYRTRVKVHHSEPQAGLQVDLHYLNFGGGIQTFAYTTVISQGGVRNQYAGTFRNISATATMDLTLKLGGPLRREMLGVVAGATGTNMSRAEFVPPGTNPATVAAVRTDLSNNPVSSFKPGVTVGCFAEHVVIPGESASLALGYQVDSIFHTRITGTIPAGPQYEIDYRATRHALRASIDTGRYATKHRGLSINLTLLIGLDKSITGSVGLGHFWNGR